MIVGRAFFAPCPPSLLTTLDGFMAALWAALWTALWAALWMALWVALWAADSQVILVHTMCPQKKLKTWLVLSQVKFAVLCAYVILSPVLLCMLCR